MKTYWTTVLKPKILSDIKEAGITNKEAIRCILKFERRLLATTNLMTKMSWYTLTHSNSYNEASSELSRLNGNSYGKKDAEFHSEWIAYCKVTTTVPTSNLGDFLS